MVMEKSIQTNGLINDIPENVLSLIFCRTSPRDVARLSAVNHASADAARSNFVWESFLPPSSSHLLKSPSPIHSKKELYDLLCEHIVLPIGTEGLWLDRASGAVCRSMSAKALQVTWGSTQEYWKWISMKGSRYPEVGHVPMVCWLDITGQWKLSLPRGLYTFSWRLKVDKAAYGWNKAPVRFSVTSTDGTVARSQCLLLTEDKPSNKGGQDEDQAPLGAKKRYLTDGWIECDVGEFSVRDGGEQEGGGWRDVELVFSMEETESGLWKGGLYVDGVVVQPSHILK